MSANSSASHRRLKTLRRADGEEREDGQVGNEVQEMWDEMRMVRGVVEVRTRNASPCTLR